ncbi:hypothetical protein LTR28_008869, partial [Elasticomyces elasticus]
NAAAAQKTRTATTHQWIMFKREQAVVEDAQKEVARPGGTPVPAFKSTLKVILARGMALMMEACFDDTRYWVMVEFLRSFSR